MSLNKALTGCWAATVPQEAKHKRMMRSIGSFITGGLVKRITIQYKMVAAENQHQTCQPHCQAAALNEKRLRTVDSQLDKLFLQLKIRIPIDTMFPEYDVVVVGAGHSGCEAAVAAANMGSRVMLATMNMNTIAQMSCNPAMGGVAKGQIVREIDAMCGYSGIVTDHTMVQFRMLNRSKGPAMWSPRAQSDRMLFAAKWREMLEANPNIDFWQEMVTGIVVKDGRAVGVRTGLGLEIPAKAVILTNGTFLNGLIHIGEKQFGGGRAGERAAKGITEQLQELGFEAGRMKTGTPPRLDGRSIDWDALEEQPGDEHPGKFSYTDTPVATRPIPCHIA